jgi:hypothetical protein
MKLAKFLKKYSVIDDGFIDDYHRLSKFMLIFFIFIFIKIIYCSMKSFIFF